MRPRPPSSALVAMTCPVSVRVSSSPRRAGEPARQHKPARRRPGSCYEDFFRRSRLMTHVVCEPCFGCKYTDCVVVCPVECFYEGEKILYIHPDECIDCEACVPECPVEAIFHEDNVPEEWKDFTQLNAEMAPQCPVITEKKEPLAET